MFQASKNLTNETVQRLETALDHFKGKFRMGKELQLEWTLNNGPKSGEVTDTIIRIHEGDPTKPIETLRHEFVEYMLT
jgi:predicted acyl esterase